MNLKVHIIPLYILQNFMRMNKLLNIYIFLINKHVCMIKIECTNYKSKILINCKLNINYNDIIIVLYREVYLIKAYTVVLADMPATL